MNKEIMNEFPLKREKYLRTIEAVLSDFELRVQNLNSLHLFDVNTISEDFMCGLLNNIYGYSLKNLNAQRSNYPGIDLGSKEDGIAVQVTSDGTRSKINKTLNKFIENKYYQDYSRLIIVVIGNKKNYRKGFDTNSLFVFDSNRDILDIKGLLQDIDKIPDTKTMQKVYEYCTYEMNRIEKASQLILNAEEYKRRAEAQCRVRLKSIGLDESVVETIVNNDLNSNRFNYIIESQKTYLVGEYGIGKSHAMNIIYLQKYRDFNEGTYDKIPCFMTAREVMQNGGIQKWLNPVSLETMPLLIMVDGLDEIDYDEAIRFMDEVDYLKERYENIQILVASRGMASISDKKTIHMNSLDDEAIDDLYKAVTGVDGRVSLYKNHSGKEFSYWKMLDRPFFLLLYALYAEKEKIVFKNDIDIIALFVNKVIKKQSLRHADVYKKLKQLAVIAVNRRMGSVHVSEIDFDPEELLKTGLVISEKDNYYSFPFPIVGQWLAALAVKDGLVDSSDITDSKRRLMKWRYPLSILFSNSSFEATKELFSRIVMNFPGIAGLIINEGTSADRQKVITEDSYDCGEKMQFCMSAWVKGLGNTAELLKISENGEKPNTLYVSVGGNYMEYSWSFFKLEEDITTYEEKGINRGFCRRTSGRIYAQSTWPWILTYETIKKRLEDVIKEKKIPVHGQLERELVWKQATKQNHKGTFYNGAIKIKDLLRYIPSDEDLECFVYEKQVYYQSLKKMDSDGVDSLLPPYPTLDIDKPNGGPIWDFFSKAQMLKRVKFEFEEGLTEYSYIVEKYFSSLKNELSLYSALPATILGQLSFYDTTWAYGPILSWCLIPLPPSEKTVIDIAYENTVDIDDEELWKRFETALNHLRADNRSFVWSSMSSGACIDISCTPVTDWVYEKLRNDLKEIKWID